MTGWTDDLLHDVHYAARTLRRAPLFTLVEEIRDGLQSWKRG
jgi:hypothetical protein